MPCTPECRSYYLTRALSPQERPYLGMLNGMVFRREEHMHNLDLGPKLLVRTMVANNLLPQCTARRTAEWLLGREMNQEGDDKWLDALAWQFVQDGFSYRQLVKSIITSERYRRVR